MGVARDLAPVFIRQFLHSFWSRATAGTVLCHITRYARRAQYFLTGGCLPKGGGGLYHFIAGGVVLKEII